MEGNAIHTEICPMDEYCNSGSNSSVVEEEEEEEEYALLCHWEIFAFLLPKKKKKERKMKRKKRGKIYEEAKGDARFRCAQSESVYSRAIRSATGFEFAEEELILPHWRFSYRGAPSAVSGKRSTAEGSLECLGGLSTVFFSGWLLANAVEKNSTFNHEERFFSKDS